MAHIIRQLESVPEDYPDKPTGLSTEAAKFDAAIVWARIKSYIAYRWTPRDVEWIVEGPGEWHPPLTPATIDTAAIKLWSGTAWETISDLNGSPLGGYVLPGHGPYQFSGSVGDDDIDVPAIVLQAYGRLAEYMVGYKGIAPGARSETLTAGSVTITASRSESWMAAAMQNSGAGDLLRSFRRAA